jgi:hypothetical protein
MKSTLLKVGFILFDETVNLALAIALSFLIAWSISVILKIDLSPGERILLVLMMADKLELKKRIMEKSK